MVYHNLKNPLSTSHHSSFKSNILFFNTLRYGSSRIQKKRKKKIRGMGGRIGGRNELDDLDQHLTRNAKGAAADY